MKLADPAKSINFLFNHQKKVAVALLSDNIPVTTDRTGDKVSGLPPPDNFRNVKENLFTRRN